MAHIIPVTKTHGKVEEKYFTSFSINADRIIQIDEINTVWGASRIKFDTEEVIDVKETRKELEKLINK